MTRDQHLIASATGVDVSLAIAGPGSRSYAYLIDWHIRFIVAAAWFICAALLTSGRVFPGAGAGKAPSVYVMSAVLPATLIYFLYHPVIEILMKGLTPGKRMAGVRIVTRLGGTPAIGALLMRNAFRLIDAMPALYVVGLTTTLFTAQRVRIGDLAAGTLLVHDSGDAIRSLARLGALAQHSNLSPEMLDVAVDLLGRWDELDPDRRAALARDLLRRTEGGTDPSLLTDLHGDALRRRLEDALRGDAAAT